MCGFTVFVRIEIDIEAVFGDLAYLIVVHVQIQQAGELAKRRQVDPFDFVVAQIYCIQILALDECLNVY